jgi:hypothetical protein
MNGYRLNVKGEPCSSYPNWPTGLRFIYSSLQIEAELKVFLHEIRLLLSKLSLPNQMICDVCRQGLDGLWDPSKTKRLGILTDFPEIVHLTYVKDDEDDGSGDWFSE